MRPAPPRSCIYGEVNTSLFLNLQSASVSSRRWRNSLEGSALLECQERCVVAQLGCRFSAWCRHWSCLYSQQRPREAIAVSVLFTLLASGLKHWQRDPDYRSSACDQIWLTLSSSLVKMICVISQARGIGGVEEWKGTIFCGKEYTCDNGVDYPYEKLGLQTPSIKHGLVVFALYLLCDACASSLTLPSSNGLCSVSGRALWLPIWVQLLPRQWWCHRERRKIGWKGQSLQAQKLLAVKLPSPWMQKLFPFQPHRCIVWLPHSAPGSQGCLILQRGKE